MTLDSALAIASGGLANINRQLAVVSQNVSNANTTGYSRQIGQQNAVAAEGEGIGVRTGTPIRSIDTLLQDEAWRQAGTLAALQQRSQALAAIDAAHGTPGQGDDLASLLGSVRDGFTALSADPSSAGQQNATLASARALASGINRISQAIGTQRQAAQDALRQETGQLNTALADIGTLSDRIRTLANAGGNTATLEDQRDAATGAVAELTGAHFVRQANGDVQVVLPGGTTLPTRNAPPLSIDDAQLSPATTGTPIMLGTQDLTAAFSGGRIGANLALRDAELPTGQAELDEFAHDLAMRFQASGLDLFTDGSTPVAGAAGTPPWQAAYLGLAGRIQVNPAISANPALLRDGSDNLGNGARDGTVIAAVLTQVFGPVAASGAIAPHTSGLGLHGNLSVAFAAPQTPADFAAAIVTVHASTASDAASRVSEAEATQATLQDRLTAVSGVSVDTEMTTMIGLQNAYAANARIITTTQQMWTQLLGMGTAAAA